MRIRGAEANHTLVFVDGIAANDPATSGEFRWETLPSDGIARAEILRGPQSALWGSEAIGGVVSVTTAEPADGRWASTQSLASVACSWAWARLVSTLCSTLFQSSQPVGMSPDHLRRAMPATRAPPMRSVALMNFRRSQARKKPAAKLAPTRKVTGAGGMPAAGAAGVEGEPGFGSGVAVKLFEMPFAG